MAVDWLGFAYAATIALGGFMGYKKKGSLMSLIAGLFFGTISTYGAYRITFDPNDIWISFCDLISPPPSPAAAAALAVVMGMRFKKSGKLMPAGFMTGLSLLMAVRTLIL